MINQKKIFIHRKKIKYLFSTNGRFVTNSKLYPLWGTDTFLSEIGIIYNLKNKDNAQFKSSHICLSDNHQIIATVLISYPNNEFSPVLKGSIFVYKVGKNGLNKLAYNYNDLILNVNARDVFLNGILTSDASLWFYYDENYKVFCIDPESRKIKKIADKPENIDRLAKMMVSDDIVYCLYSKYLFDTRSARFVLHIRNLDGKLKNTHEFTIKTNIIGTTPFHIDENRVYFIKSEYDTKEGPNILPEKTSLIIYNFKANKEYMYKLNEQS